MFNTDHRRRSGVCWPYQAELASTPPSRLSSTAEHDGPSARPPLRWGRFFAADLEKHPAPNGLVFPRRRSLEVIACGRLPLTAGRRRGKSRAIARAASREYQRKNDEKKTHEIAATAESFRIVVAMAFQFVKTGKRPPTRVALPASLSPRHSRVFPAAVRTDVNAGLQCAFAARHIWSPSA